MDFRHEQEHLNQLAVTFRALHEALNVAMAEPTAPNGYKLRAALDRHAAALVDWQMCVQGQAHDVEPEKPPEDDGPKSLVN